MPVTEPIDLAFKARFLRAAMRHKAELGLGDDQQVMIVGSLVILAVPRLRAIVARALAVEADDRLDA